jgi:hypothetical protein
MSVLDCVGLVANKQATSTEGNDLDDDDDVEITEADADASNGGNSDEEEEEEEPSMPGPAEPSTIPRKDSSSLPGPLVNVYTYVYVGGLINPWTGEDMSSVINDDDSSGRGGESK